jgi:cobalt transporter subunit CbtA
MIARVLFAAVLAGIAAGFVMSAVQMWQVMPLIAQAEEYEEMAAAGHASARAEEAGESHSHTHSHDHSHGEGAEHGHSHSHEASAGHSHDGDHGHANEEASGHGHSHDGWMPEDGIERTTFTILANIVSGVGFAMVLVAGVLFSGREITAANGVVWGLIGFFVFAVAPAAGLPPELPGMGGGDIATRQVWWIATALATAAGLAAIVLFPGALAKVLGIGLIALPHLIGAPVAHSTDSLVPAGARRRIRGCLAGQRRDLLDRDRVATGWLLQREPEAREAHI